MEIIFYICVILCIFSCMNMIQRAREIVIFNSKCKKINFEEREQLMKSLGLNNIASLSTFEFLITIVGLCSSQWFFFLFLLITEFGYTFFKESLIGITILQYFCIVVYVFILLNKYQFHLTFL